MGTASRELREQEMHLIAVLERIELVVPRELAEAMGAVEEPELDEVVVLRGDGVYLEAEKAVADKSESGNECQIPRREDQCMRVVGPRARIVRAA